MNIGKMQNNPDELNLTIRDFKDDVYVGVDKHLLKQIISQVKAAKIAKNLGLHRDTVELWYRNRRRGIPISDLRYICQLTRTDLNKFQVRWIGGKGNIRNRLTPFFNSDWIFWESHLCLSNDPAAPVRSSPLVFIGCLGRVFFPKGDLGSHTKASLLHHFYHPSAGLVRN